MSFEEPVLLKQRALVAIFHLPGGTGRCWPGAKSPRIYRIVNNTTAGFPKINAAPILRALVRKVMSKTIIIRKR